MDLRKLPSLKHWFEYSSFTLNLENFVILNNSLLLLQNDNHFQKIFFWGLIEGVESDYYISFGYKTDAITERTFFYSDDCQNWKLLPNPQPQHLILTELCKIPFQGDPGLVIEVIDDAPEEEIYPEKVGPVGVYIGGSGEKLKNLSVDADNHQPERNPLLEKEKNEKNPTAPLTSGELKEEDRLAAAVHIILEETAIMPRGALFKQTDGTNVHSQAFEGLNVDEADKLCSFLHYRPPLNDWNTNLLTRVDYNYALDFLDTIDNDIPSDVWSAQLVEGDRAVVLQNLMWPGFMFFHHLSTPDHGCIYVGTGQRNLDIPFMTQTKLTQVTEPFISREASAITNKSRSPQADKSPSMTKHPSVQQIKKLGETTKEPELEEEQDDFEGEIITSA